MKDVKDMVRVHEPYGGATVEERKAAMRRGMSDEDKLGFTYAMLDHYVLTGECEDEEKKARIDRLHRLNLHKLRLMPKFEMSDDR